MSKKVLVIDDDKEILFSMSAICEVAGLTPIVALNVKEGIRKYKSFKPDVILMDYHLPVINGIEGTKMIRELDLFVPIIVLTVEEEQSVADMFLKAGASDFALKPIKAPDIISRINVNLKLRESMEVNTKPSDDYFKGISITTMKKIGQCMKTRDKYMTIDEIAKHSSLSYQTVHRYLYHMENEDLVTIMSDYGKVGRPKKKYKLK